MPSSSTCAKSVCRSGRYDAGDSPFRVDAESACLVVESRRGAILVVDERVVRLHVEMRRCPAIDDDRCRPDETWRVRGARNRHLRQRRQLVNSSAHATAELIPHSFAAFAERIDRKGMMKSAVHPPSEVGGRTPTSRSVVARLFVGHLPDRTARPGAFVRTNALRDRRRW